MSERQSSYHPVLAAGSRSALLAALEAAGRPLGVAEAAAAIGTSESTARFHLSLLVSAGLVTKSADRRASAGRPFLRYAPAEPPLPVPVDEAPPLASTPPDPAPDRYEELAALLAGQLDDTADAAGMAREAGRRWTPALAGMAGTTATTVVATTQAVHGLMARLGFSPEPSTATARDEIRLRSCPFESVARRHRDVVCGVHLGLLEQTIAGLGGAAVVDRFQPFAADDPLLCVVGLRTASPA